MAKIVAVFNQKGGVGKSTSAVNIGAYLALAGKRTLLIDLDAQGNASTACGIPRQDSESTIYAVILGEKSIGELAAKSSVEGFHVVPANLDLAGAELFLSQQDARETVLRRAIEPVRPHYDFIILDCPPSIGLVTINALVAADCTIIPIQCEYLSLEGLNAMVKTVDMIRQQLNPQLHIDGILMTMTDFRANLTKEVAAEVKKYFPSQVFDATIPRSIRLAESPSFGKPICQYDPHSAGALAYQMVTQEILKREGEA